MRDGRSRRGRHEGLRSNPFVVLADMTIGLSFFFAVFSVVAVLANSKATALLERQNRQDEVKVEAVAAVKSAYPGASSSDVTSAEGDTFTQVKDADGRPLLEIWENGNFQRMKIFAPVFTGPRSSDLTDPGGRLYAQLGDMIKRHARELSYLFLHGIVEPSEVTDSPPGREDAVALSRRRADIVFYRMIRAGVIARDSDIAKPDQIQQKYAIAYGTGVDLYTRVLPKDATNDKTWNDGKTLGRVDLVLFYEEEKTEANAGAA